MSSWDADLILHSNTVWFPQLRLAAQAMSHLASIWIQSPWTTQAIILVPWIFSRMWAKVNKHFVWLHTVKYRDDKAEFWNSLLPLCVIYLPLFVCSLPLLPSRSDDLSAIPQQAQWHRAQAKKVRNLQSSGENNKLNSMVICLIILP
eukprot:13154116-Ditylum_brightwellii.AAC.1